MPSAYVEMIESEIDKLDTVQVRLDVYVSFFFSSRRRHTRCLSDWSSDVCSSDLVCPRFSAEPVRGVHGVPDDGVLEPAIGPDVSGEYLAEVDCDSDLDLGTPLLLPLGVELFQLCELIDGTAHRAVGVVFVRDRRAPQRHDRVAHELVERAAVLEHLVHHLGEIL